MEDYDGILLQVEQGFTCNISRLSPHPVKAVIVLLEKQPCFFGVTSLSRDTSVPGSFT
jgi:hypothetical protein